MIVEKLFNLINILKKMKKIKQNKNLGFSVLIKVFKRSVILYSNYKLNC